MAAPSPSEPAAPGRPSVSSASRAGLQVLLLAHSVSDHRGGGEAVAAYGLARHLGQAGVAVDLATPHYVVERELPPTVRIRLAPVPDERWGHSGATKGALVSLSRALVAKRRYDAVHLVSQFTSFPIPAHPFVISGCVNVEEAAAPRRLGRLRTFGEDLRRHGAASVTRDLAYALRHERLAGWTLGRTIREADAVIVRESTGRERPPAGARRVEVIPFGVDVGPPPDLERPRPPIVLFVGGLFDYKGVDVLVRAFPRVLREQEDAVLHIVGEGPLRAGLEALAAELGITERVRFHGPLPRSQVAAWYGRASVFALPSRGESFGQVNAEAMAAGTPVVTTDRIAGARDYLEDGRNGRVVPADDVDALSSALLEVLGDEDLRRRWGAAARASIERFDWPLIAARHVELYRSLRA